MKKVDIGISYPFQLDGDWYFRAMIGPFETKEEADKAASRVGILEIDEAPPPLGVNVSETIATKDKFG